MKDWTQHLAPAAPPAGVVGLHFLGVPLETWVLITTITYTVLATIRLVTAWYKELRNGRK